MTSFLKIIFCFSFIERWAFDVELLKIGEMCGIPLNEVAVEWTEIDGSKLQSFFCGSFGAKNLFCQWTFGVFFPSFAGFPCFFPSFAGGEVGGAGQSDR